eukprot:4729772-Amphidinium_carterae.3
MSTEGAEGRETKLLQAEWDKLKRGISGPQSQKCPQAMTMRALLDHFRTWSEQDVFATISSETGLTLYQHILRDKTASLKGDDGAPKFSGVYYDNLTQIYAAKTNPLKAIQPSVKEGTVTPGLRNGILRAKQNCREELLFFLRTHRGVPTEHDVCGLLRWVSTLNVHGAKDQLETGVAVMRFYAKHELQVKYAAWQTVMAHTWESIVSEVLS